MKCFLSGLKYNMKCSTLIDTQGRLMICVLEDRTDSVRVYLVNPG